VGAAQRPGSQQLLEAAARCYDAALPQRFHPPMSHNPPALATDAFRVARPWSRGVLGGMGKRSIGSAQAPT